MAYRITDDMPDDLTHPFATNKNLDSETTIPVLLWRFQNRGHSSSDIFS